jgi:peptidyl-prolyl cis-trans isomerase SurA
MKRYSLILILFVSFITNKALSQNKDATVLSIENEKVSVEEFENIFKKNNRDSVITQAALDEYMELFINFKLKVQEAKSLGLDTVARFKTELDGYRTQLARPYLTDGDMLNGLIREAYNRQREEVHAAHILVKCDAKATPADTLMAYTKAMALRDRILSGEDFGKVAMISSEDPSAKENHGDLGFFTVFQMVYPFEDAAFRTKEGEVSMPVRTSYGYHLIKVIEKRAAQGEIHVAHIMVKPRPEDGGEQNAEAKAQEIYEKLVSKELTFEDAALKYSEDGSSAKKGGELPWFGTGRMVEEFERAAFALKQDGDISKPFKSSHGWHIVKRLGYKPLATFEEMEKELKNKVSKDGRSEKTRTSFVQKLKKEYNYSIDEKIAQQVYAKADSNVFKGTWNLKKSLNKKNLMSIGGKSIKVSDFVQYMNKRGIVRGMQQSPVDYVKTMVAKYSEEQLMAHEDSKLEQKYTPFRLLMKEYKEGILLFELTDQKVWSKAVKDSAGLAQFYEENKKNYMHPERANVVIYTCANEKVAEQLRKMINQGRDRTAIAGELNKNSQLNLQIEEGVFAKADRSTFSHFSYFRRGLSDNIQENGQIIIVDTKEILQSTPKKLEEARGAVTSDYQTYLEEQWIKELRSKYKYSVNKDVLYTIH